MVLDDGERLKCGKKKPNASGETMVQQCQTKKHRRKRILSKGSTKAKETDTWANT